MDGKLKHYHKLYKIEIQSLYELNEISKDIKDFLRDIWCDIEDITYEDYVGSFDAGKVYDLILLDEEKQLLNVLSKIYTLENNQDKTNDLKALELLFKQLGHLNDMEDIENNMEEILQNNVIQQIYEDIVGIVKVDFEVIKEYVSLKPLEEEK
jgi:hypothetical protein